MAQFQDFRQMEQEGWSQNAIAVSYADGFVRATKQAVPALIKAVDSVVGDQALDICCGNGVVTKGLLDSGFQATGLDFSPAMIELARQSVPGAVFEQGDALALPFDDETFDVVTIGFGILHVPDAHKALEQARRVLKPQGKIAFSTWKSPKHSLAFKILFKAIEEYGDPAIQLPEGPEMFDYADQDFAYRALEAAGFTNFETADVDSFLLLSDPSHPYDIFKNGTVRGGKLLHAQPPKNAQNIRNSVVEQVIAELGKTCPWRVPIPSVVYSATA